MTTLQGLIEKSPIFLSQYLKNEWLDGNTIISYLVGSNSIWSSNRIMSMILRVSQIQDILFFLNLEREMPFWNINRFCKFGTYSKNRKKTLW